MARTFRVKPLSDDEMVALLVADVRLRAARIAGTVHSRGYVLASEEDLSSYGEVEIPLDKVAGISFDGELWWLPFDHREDPERQADDDAGELMKSNEGFRSDLKRWADGYLTAAQCQQHFRAIGVPWTTTAGFSNDPTDWTDDPGEMGPADPI